MNRDDAALELHQCMDTVEFELDHLKTMMNNQSFSGIYNAVHLLEASKVTSGDEVLTLKLRALEAQFEDVIECSKKLRDRCIWTYMDFKAQFDSNNAIMETLREEAPTATVMLVDVYDGSCAGEVRGCVTLWKAYEDLVPTFQAMISEGRTVPWDAYEKTELYLLALVYVVNGYPDKYVKCCRQLGKEPATQRYSEASNIPRSKTMACLAVYLNGFCKTRKQLSSKTTELMHKLFSRKDYVTPQNIIDCFQDRRCTVHYDLVEDPMSHEQWLACGTPNGAKTLLINLSVSKESGAQNFWQLEAWLDAKEDVLAQPTGETMKHHYNGLIHAFQPRKRRRK